MFEAVPEDPALSLQQRRQSGVVDQQLHIPDKHLLTVLAGYFGVGGVNFDA
jgi:hypothetical protein